MIEDTRNVVDDYRGRSVEDIAADMRSRAFEFEIAIENFQHDFNIGSIVRSANAFNVRRVHIIGKRHWNRRGAMMTEAYLDVVHHADPAAFLAYQKTSGLRLIGVDNVANSKALHEVELPKNSLLVFGQEGPGLSDEMKTACEYLVAIEQFGSTRSINVGAAAAIVMYSWVSKHALTS